MTDVLFSIDVLRSGVCELSGAAPVSDAAKREVIRVAMTGLSRQCLQWRIDLYSLLDAGEKSQLAARLKAEGIHG